MKKSVVVAALTVQTFAVVGSPAHAADCTFATAIYSQPETGYELRFQPQQRLARLGGTTNVFFLDGPNVPKDTAASVSWNNGESRPTGWLMLNCPDDASSEEEFGDCIQWKGVIYELADGTAKLLPGEAESPPQRILLSDFGRQLRYAANMLENPPWDVFEFNKCGTDETAKSD